MSMSEHVYTLEYIASYLDSKIAAGDKARIILTLSAVNDIHIDSIVCVAKLSELDFVLNSEAACLVVARELLPFDLKGKAAIVVDDVKHSFAKLLALFFKEKQCPSGTIEPSAIISKTANICSNVYIAHNVVIGENSTIGDGSVILSNTVIGDNVIIKNGCKINSNVVLHDDTIIEDNVTIGSSSVIGGDGFGYYVKNGKHNKIPQKGNVVICSDVEIGSSVTIDRAVIGSTIVGRCTKIDNLVHIAHNCKIGENVIIVAQVGIAGSSTIGNWTMLAGQVGIADHVNIGDNVVVGAKSGVISGSKVADKSVLFGCPAQDMHKEKMSVVAYRKLPKILEAVEKLIGKRIK